MGQVFDQKPLEVRQIIKDKNLDPRTRHNRLSQLGTLGGLTAARNRALRRAQLEAEFYARALAENRHICPLDDEDPGVPMPPED